jgi:hypothetical protein
MHQPHLITDGFLFLTLFRGQHGEEIAHAFDPHEAQLGFERFTLFDLGFDRGQLCLLIRHERAEFSLRHLDIRVSPDLRPVLIKGQGLQLGHLIVRQAEVLLML